jgi:hypothetical protein
MTPDEYEQWKDLEAIWLGKINQMSQEQIEEVNDMRIDIFNSDNLIRVKALKDKLSTGLDPIDQHPPGTLFLRKSRRQSNALNAPKRPVPLNSECPSVPTLRDPGFKGYRVSHCQFELQVILDWKDGLLGNTTKVQTVPYFVSMDQLRQNTLSQAEYNRLPCLPNGIKPVGYDEFGRPYSLMFIQTTAKSHHEFFRLSGENGLLFS